MRINTRTLVIAGLVAGAMLLAGCSDSDDTAETGGGPDISAPASDGSPAPDDADGADPSLGDENAGDAGSGDAGGGEAGDAGAGTGEADAGAEAAPASDDTSDTNTWAVVLIFVAALALIIWLASRSGAEKGAREGAQAEQETYPSDPGGTPPPASQG